MKQSRGETRVTRTLVLRLIRDEQNHWHVAITEPGGDDGWRTTCVGLNMAWAIVRQRLGCTPDVASDDSTDDVRSEQHLL
jgi:hypothetical protein